MSQAKKEYRKWCKSSLPMRDKACVDYVIELEWTLLCARKYIQKIYDNSDPCTCPAEGDCVCGQPELLNIMKKIDEVIG
jgi:hypothetical protein